MNLKNRYTLGTKPILIVASSTLLIKLILFPYVQVTDADAVSRVFITINWMKHPAWITSGVWGPFHFYLNSIALFIWNNTIYAPGLLNVILSVLTLFPFYYFTRREFNEQGALIATIFLAICPILFHYSFLALSETPYIFFLVLTMNFLSKGMKENNKLHFVFAGLFITLAAGFRYEAWLVIPIFGLLLLLSGKWKGAVLYGMVALLFPLIWMIQNYFKTGNALHSISPEQKEWGIFNSLAFKESLMTLWFFPFSWMISLGPAAAFVIIAEIFACYRSTEKSIDLKLWTLPFWTVLICFIYFCHNGSLLLAHRFTCTLTVLSLPYLALYFNVLSFKKIKYAFIFGTLTIGLSFAWNTPGVQPLPRLEDQSAVQVAELIKTETNNNSGLIIDFWSWQNTYYVALHSILPPKNIILVGGDKSYDLPSSPRLTQLLADYPTGIILIRKNSEFDHEIVVKGNQLNFESIATRLHVKILYENDGIMVLNYVTI